MADEKNHHFSSLHKKEQTTDIEKKVDYKKKEKHHKHLQIIGGLGAAAAGTYALHEKHQVKKDPKNAHKHKIAGEVASLAALGAGGFAFHERHEKKRAAKLAK